MCGNWHSDHKPRAPDVISVQFELMQMQKLCNFNARFSRNKIARAFERGALIYLICLSTEPLNIARMAKGGAINKCANYLRMD